MVEFAILSPLIIVLLLGVLQIGIAMQNYNALRNATAEVARYAMVQYATGNKLTDAQLTSYATSVARAAPYLLTSTMAVKVDDVATPRVTGTTEKTLRVDYKIPSLLDTLGLEGPAITYSRTLILTS